MVVIRGEGPKGGPGMPEMLTPTSAIMGAGLGKVCLAFFYTIYLKCHNFETKLNFNRLCASKLKGLLHEGGY